MPWGTNMGNMYRSASVVSHQLDIQSSLRSAMRKICQNKATNAPLYTSLFSYAQMTQLLSEMKHMFMWISIHFFQENPKKTSVPHLIPSFFPAPYVRYAVLRPLHFRMHAVCVWKNGRQQLLRFRDYDLQTWRQWLGWWFSGIFFHLCNAWFWGGNIYIYA